MPPLDPRIPMGFRQPEFANPLDMALKGGKLAALMQGQQANELLMQQKQQERDVMNQYRQGIAALGPDATPENMLSVALKSGAVGPKDLATIVSTNENKKLALQQHVWGLKLQHDYRMSELETRLREGRITKQEADARAADLRRDLEIGRQDATRELHEMDAKNREGFIRLAASLRPPPAAEPLEKIIGPDGEPVLVPRKQAIGARPASADKPLTEFQGKNVLYGTRAAQSDKILKGLEEKISLPGLAATRTLGPLGNYLRSSEQQRVDQAQRDFVNAVLRQESGAVISEAEFENAQKQYFPQPGDDAKTIAQKRENRQTAIKGFTRIAGPGGADIKAVSDAPLLPKSASIPQQAAAYLKANPQTREAFDAKYGAGESAKILGK